MNASQQTADEVAERLFGSLLGTVEIMSVYLGDRLGWYRVAGRDGPASADELARADRHPGPLRPRVARAAGRGRAAGGRLRRRRRRASLRHPGEHGRGADRPDEPGLPGAARPDVRRGRARAARSSSRPTGTAAASAGTTSATTRGSRRPTRTGRGSSSSSARALAGVPAIARRPRRPGCRIARRRLRRRLVEHRAGPRLPRGHGRRRRHRRSRRSSWPRANAARRGRGATGSASCARTRPACRGGRFDAAFAFECVHDMPRPVEVLARGPAGARARRLRWS